MPVFTFWFAAVIPFDASTMQPCGSQLILKEANVSMLFCHCVQSCWAFAAPRSRSSSARSRWLHCNPLCGSQWSPSNSGNGIYYL